MVVEWGDEEEQMMKFLDSEFFYIYESDDSVLIIKYKNPCLCSEQ